MHTLSQEFLALCRQLGEAQTRCSEVVAEQAAELERLQREVVRLRAAVIVRDTRLEQAHAALEDARQAQPPGLPRRKEMARHIRMLAERVASLSRECLRWRLQAAVQEVSEPAAPPQDEAEARGKARLGALGYHPSLLPRHRGRDAIRWALHMGDVVTGGTVYWLDDGADTGPIAAQDWCWVEPGDTPESLWRRVLGPMGLRLFDQVLAALDTGAVPSASQDTRMATWEPSFNPGKLAAS